MWRLTIAKCIAETRCLLCHCSSVLSVLPSQSVCARGERIGVLVSAVTLAGMTLRRNLTLVTVPLEAWVSTAPCSLWRVCRGDCMH